MSTHSKDSKLTNKQRIKEIVALLDSLSTELSERLAIEDQPKSSPSNSSASYKSTTSFNFPPPICVGDRVVITNKYRNLKGRTGVIQRITRTFYFLKLDGTDEIVQKVKSNVLRVSHEHNNDG